MVDRVMNEIQQKKKTILSLLNKLENIAWRESRQDPGGILVWVPILSLDAEKYGIGISNQGYWVVSCYNQIILQDNENDMRSLLPCLKADYGYLTAMAQEGLAKNNLSLALWDTFPRQTLVEFALNFDSDFWANLALGWLPYVELNKQIQMSLSKVSTASWSTQGTRQKADKWLKKFRSKGTAHEQ
jgi:hypothetical protein